MKNFSEKLPKRKGLFISSERPSVVGGLGRVSVDIPRSLNLYAGYDCRVIQPFTAFHKKMQKNLPESEQFIDTGLTKEIEIKSNRTQQFRLLQRYELENKTWVYAIQNNLFERYDHLYLSKSILVDSPELKEVYGRDPIFYVNMLYTRAVAAFIPYIRKISLNMELSITENTENIDYSQEDFDFIIINDWLTGQLANELNSALTKATKPAYIFMLHNLYDQKRTISEAKKCKINIAEFFQEELNEVQKNYSSIGANSIKYSPLRTGIRLSDWLIIDGNYLYTLTQTATRLPTNTKIDLKNKYDKAQFTTVVHAPAKEFSPYKNIYLHGSKEGFRAIEQDLFESGMKDDECKEILANFKQTNKIALQKMYEKKNSKIGFLNLEPESLIYVWAARFDPYQKGFFIMAEACKKFMYKNSNVQVLIAGAGGVGDLDPDCQIVIESFFAEMLSDKKLRGRLVRTGRLDEKSLVQLLSGSTALMHPSLYEPYGLSQLEAMSMGTIPIAHAVDGLLSTIRDSNEISACEIEEMRPPLKYGQTGYLMPRIKSVLAYENALRAWMRINASSAETGKKFLQSSKQQTLDDANLAFYETLERSYIDLQNREKRLELVLNTMFYVKEIHDWSHISKRYELAIESAIMSAK